MNCSLDRLLGIIVGFFFFSVYLRDRILYFRLGFFLVFVVFWVICVCVCGVVFKGLGVIIEIRFVI